MEYSSVRYIGAGSICTTCTDSTTTRSTCTLVEKELDTRMCWQLDTVHRWTSVPVHQQNSRDTRNYKEVARKGSRRELQYEVVPYSRRPWGTKGTDCTTLYIA